MRPVVASGVGHLILQGSFEVKSWDNIVGFAQPELWSINTKTDNPTPYLLALVEKANSCYSLHSL